MATFVTAAVWGPREMQVCRGSKWGGVGRTRGSLRWERGANAHEPHGGGRARSPILHPVRVSYPSKPCGIQSPGIPFPAPMPISWQVLAPATSQPRMADEGPAPRRLTGAWERHGRTSRYAPLFRTEDSYARIGSRQCRIVLCCIGCRYQCHRPSFAGVLILWLC